MKHLIKFFSFYIILALLISCKDKVAETPVDKAFCLTDTLKTKVVIDTVKDEPVKNAVSLSGKIEANEDKWIKVFPTVGGVVEEMKVQLGDYVTKGQTLAVIRSSEIADYQSQLSYASSSVKIAQKNLTSTKEMFASGLATDKDVVAAETELEKAKADQKRIEQTTSIFGAKSNAIQTITAPMSGYIIEKNVTDKMQFRVDGAQPFFTIANLDEVWVIANVFESDISKIKMGAEGEIKLIAYKDKVFTGKIDRIFNILDPQSRVMKVRIRIPNPDNFLKPEMFAKITVRYESNSGALPCIPAAAVIFNDNKNYVVVYKNDCSLENREIELSETIGEKAFIKSGLVSGEKVLSKYQLLVFNSLNK